MTTNGTSRKLINETCLGLLLIEVVDFLKSSGDKEETSSTFSTASQSLELLGFQVGQSLMEKYV